MTSALAVIETELFPADFLTKLNAYQIERDEVIGKLRSKGKPVTEHKKELIQKQLLRKHGLAGKPAA